MGPTSRANRLTLWVWPLAALLLVLALPLVAAAQEPWFGLPLPTGPSTPHEPTILLDDDGKAAPLPALVPTGEERWQHLEGARIRPYLERIVRFSLRSRERGDALWGRIAGMSSLQETAEWVAEEFTTAGLANVGVDDFDVTESLWIPSEWTVTVRRSGDPDVVLESAFPQRPSPAIDAVLNAPLVFVGAGSSADLANVSVDGKVAVVHKKPDPGLCHSRIDTTGIVAGGAVAMIHVIELPGNMYSFDAGGCASTIPCFHVGGQDGFFLEAAIGAAAGAGHPPLEVSVSLGVEERPNTTAANAVGIVPGNGRTNENIIINAHADGWFDGASDNADGLAVLIALARHFGETPGVLDRDLVFVASAGHHTRGGNGPSAFVAAHPELTGRTALVINIEHVAQLNMSTSVSRPEAGYHELVADITEFPKSAGVSNQSPFLVDLVKRAATRYGVNVQQQVGPAVPGDLGGYRSLGVPLAQFIYASPMYHTSGDVLDTISTPGLERAARYHAFVIAEAANARLEQLQPAR